MGDREQLWLFRSLVIEWRKFFGSCLKLPHAGIACRCLACRPQRWWRKLKRATALSFWLPIQIKARVRFAQYILNFRYHVDNFKTSATKPRIFDLPADIIKIRCNLTNSKESRCEHDFLYWLMNLCTNKRETLANTTHKHQILSKYV